MQSVSGLVAYGIDMEMTATGKVSNLVEVMAQVFVSCMKSRRSV